MSGEGDARLMYQPFSSILNPGFWQQLTNVKINHLKLSKEPLDIQGSYSCNLSDTLPCLAAFEHSSFGQISKSSNRSSCPLYGQLICTNILQEFLDLNKKEFLDNHGKEIWKSILDGRALSEPEKYLSRFAVLVFADLKRYKFFYWFAFPAINYPQDVCIRSQKPLAKTDVGPTHQPILDVFPEDILQQIQDAYDRPSHDRNFARGYFIVKHFKDLSTEKDAVSLYPLTEYQAAKKDGDHQKNTTLYFAFTDPSAHLVYPGWPLRNYLCLIAVQFGLTSANVIRIRKGPPTSKSKIELQHSKVLSVSYDLDATYDRLSANIPSITGWEKNESQQIAPKRVNLSNLLDPKRLAEDAVNLNLRLMKWRLIPDLDLDKIAETSCLILGCGTLGCHVARGLLAWGVKRLTLVDNGKISYSNPVRQSLYEFNDCTQPGGIYKAKAAADALKRIHPLVQVEHQVLSIPMPGHHISDQIMDQTKDDIVTLADLIEDHDVIFLLMDTRESRWLPTVISKTKHKLVINAAIGFDTFLLQRFGVRSRHDALDLQKINQEESPTIRSTTCGDPFLGDSREKRVKNYVSGTKLGCYFCNDVVAPGDSTQDRTLDQQCTVSRPGVSMMVSALAVEFLASIVSSRLGAESPAPLDVRSDTVFYEEDYGGELGIVPHSLRGNLATYQIYMPTTPAFHKCAACSEAVISAYQTSGYGFLSRVFDDPSYLEEVAGLKDLQNVNDNVWALDSDEDDMACIEKQVDDVTI